MNGQQARMYRLYFLDESHRVESWQALHCTLTQRHLRRLLLLWVTALQWRSLKVSEL